jgi:DNA-binding MarR family transcriptional regulator
MSIGLAYPPMPKANKKPNLLTTAGTVFEASPSFLICALGNRIAVKAERNIRKTFDLSLMEWRVLSVLAVEPSAPPGRIVAVSGVNKAAVSRAVNSLEQRGLLKRESAPDHGLRTHLFLTRAGQTLHKRGNGQRLHAEEQLLAGLSKTQRSQLSELLRRLMRNLDDTARVRES